MCHKLCVKEIYVPIFMWWALSGLKLKIDLSFMYSLIYHKGENIISLNSGDETQKN
jgi:hypothetical protein